MIAIRTRTWAQTVLIALLFLLTCVTNAEEQEPEASGSEYQQIPFKSDAPDQQVSLLRVSLTFGLLVGLLFLGVYGYKYFSQLGSNSLAKRTSRIKILESKGLPGKASISLVRVDKVEYLVVRTHQDVSVVEHKDNDES